MEPLLPVNASQTPARLSKQWLGLVYSQCESEDPRVHAKIDLCNVTRNQTIRFKLQLVKENLNT